MPLTTVDQGLLGQYAQYTGFKNRIINGGMQVAQYGTSATLTANGASAYTCDRYRCDPPVNNNVSISQSSSAPTGFVNSLQYTTTTGATNTADTAQIFYCIEGNNVADLNLGTANAKPFVLSFWAKSTVAGTYGLVLGESSNNFAYVTTYVLPANTWTYVTLSIPAPTSGGTWLTNNGRGLVIRWDMGVGSINSTAATNAWTAYGSAYQGVTGATKLTANSSATFNLTGVQLEKGSTATSFDYRPYGTELALCQRYYYQTISASATQYVINSFNNGPSRIRGMMPLPAPMRSSASLSVIQSNGFYPYSGGAITYSSVASFVHQAGSNNCMVDINVSGTASGFYDWAAVLGLSAEL